MESSLKVIPPDARFTITVPESAPSLRIDVFLTQQFPSYSRSFFQRLIADSLVQINQTVVEKVSTLVKPTDTIDVQFPPLPEFKPKEDIPKNIGVTIVYTHPDFYIINKPAHLMVHPPSSYTTEVTLVDWLRAYFPELAGVGTVDRPGVVHRLDRGTSGLMIIARNLVSHKLFSDMFRNRTIQKTYWAVVAGHPDKTGTIDFAISRDPHAKTKMTHRNPKGRHATTHYNVLQYFHDATLLALKPITGRTHQLRVHCAAIGHPIIGDTQYGTPSTVIDHQALHAQSLEFIFQDREYQFSQEPPEDFMRLLANLKSAPKLPA